MIAALETPRDRALWATAFYAGLRRGELMALRRADVDLANGILHVRDSYDPKEREFVGVKSRAGERRIPIAGALRDALDELRLDALEPDALVFGEDDSRPFAYEEMLDRAEERWAKAKLKPVGLHDPRHTCASVMIAASVNIKALSEFLGHASITITLDRYGHLLPGSIEEAARLLDAFLAGATTARNVSESATFETS